MGYSMRLEKGERTIIKFKTTKLPKIHTYTKKTVNETQNHFNANTHTHTHTHTLNYKHIKYQRRVKQTKVNTPQERETTTPI